MTPLVNFSRSESNDETLWFEVTSSSRNDVSFDVGIDKTNKWICTCEDYYYRKRFCKHMRMVRDYFNKYLSEVFSDFGDVVNSDVVYNDVREDVVYGC